MSTIYEAVGGIAVLERLADAWYERCLADPLAAHPFEGGVHPDHTERLAAYWAETLGGPPRYSCELGTESDVVRMHSGNSDATGPIIAAGAACFAGALDDVGISDPELRRQLVDWWARSSERMDRYPHSIDDVPDDLTIPVWPDAGA